MKGFKPIKPNSRFAAIAAIFALLFLGGLFFLNRVEFLSDDKEKESRVFWTSRIRKIGSESAYGEFKKWNYGRPLGVQHQNVHYFGSALYLSEGVSGVAACDASFGFGCYHSFFLEAIRNNGLSILKELDAECVKKFGVGGQGCQHGLGHGLLDYFGPNRLTEALRKCGDLQWQKRLFGCQSGVFMEYNFPSLLGDEAGSVSGYNHFDADDPYNPCDKIPDKFRLACFYSLPEFWLRSETASYDEMSNLCDGIKNEEYKDICFAGIGAAFMPFSNFNTAVAGDLCRNLGDDVRAALCYGGLSFAFADNGQTAEAAKVCDESSDEKLCLRYRRRIYEAWDEN